MPTSKVGNAQVHVEDSHGNVEDELENTVGASLSKPRMAKPQRANEPELNEGIAAALEKLRRQ